MRSLKAEEAKSVLLKNQENIVRKAADGRVLTAGEQTILENIISKPLTARQLADELGISRRTVFYLRRNADGPAGTDLDEWKQYLEERSATDDSGRNDELLPEQLQKVKARLLRAQAGKEEAMRRLKELELEQEEKQLVPSTAAEEVIKEVLGPVRAGLDSLPKLVAHNANPSEPLMAEKAIEDGLDNLFKQIEKHAGKSKNK